MKRTTTFLVVAVLGMAAGQEFGGHALFIRTSPAAGKEDTEGLSESDTNTIARTRVQRAAPASPADVMAQNILEWIQGIYRQGARKIRQQSEGYLPPYSTQRPPEKPRPFQTQSTLQQSSFPFSSQNEVTPQRPSSLYTPPTGGFGSNQPSSQQAPPFSTTRPTYTSPSTQTTFGTSYSSRPTPQPSYSTGGGSSGFSSTRGSTTYLPPQTGYSVTTPRPVSTTLPPVPSGFSASTGFSSPSQFSPTGGLSTSVGITTNYGYSSQRPSSGIDVSRGSTAIGVSLPPGYSTSGGYSSPGGFSSTYGYTTQRPTTGFVTSGGGVSSTGYTPQGGYTTYGYSSQRPTVGFPTTTGESTSRAPVVTEGYVSSTPYPPFSTPDVSTGGSGDTTKTTGPTVISGGTGSTIGEGTTGVGQTVSTDSEEDDDLKHPPHIHSLNVECSKTMMTINIEFNRAFDGVIYSKGFFTTPECRYVEQNSGQTAYSFTVNLDSCGTQFINDFEGEAGQAYLENVLVLQNEPGIQEVWDTIRRVRCLWEGNINKALSVNLSVDMLNQEIVTFSGDTATAKLDIQIGRGPFAPAADGLVKIGETMTLVVSVEGDPAFDLQVRDCLARDESSTNVVQLTDERGCILKPKLFGAFQKTNDTGNTGASLIAYAFFQAFKFPDVMDLFIECNVELCKVDCQPCPEENQQIEPGRRRRSVTYAPWNTTGFFLSDPVRVGRGFKVIMIDDLSTASSQILERLEETAVEEATRTRNVCMSNSGFYAAFSLMLSTVVVTTISAAILYVKLQRIHRTKSLHS